MNFRYFLEMAKINDILKYDLCLGCGLCSAIDSHCSMRINNRGFYEPHDFSDKNYVVMKKLCPGIYLNNSIPGNTTVWGNVESVYNAWAADERIRKLSASGGVTTALAVYLLESGKVDGVLHIGHCDNDYLHNQLFVSRSREEVLKRMGSRYAPAAVFDQIFDILNENGEEKYAFIGKPCDIACMQSIISFYSQYKNKVTYFLAIFCAGMPSYYATEKAISTFSVSSKPISVNYRDEGWPGFFTVRFENGCKKEMSYNDSWGKILGRDLGFRCKICPDGIGLQADISSGDSWNTKDGYPDFAESEGKNFCFIRTKIGQRLFDDACNAGYIIREEFNVTVVKYQQRYQYDRRHYVGWRILVVQLLTGGLLHYRGMKMYKIALKANWIKAIRDALGTAKRLLKVRQKWEVQIK